MVSAELRKDARSVRRWLAALRHRRAVEDVPDCYYRDASGDIHVLL